MPSRPSSPAPRSPGRRPAYPEGERGIALLLVFLLVLILMPFASEFAIQVSLESKTAQNVTDQLLIENAIDGQFEIVLARLRYDLLLDDKTDSWTDEWNSDEIREHKEEDIEVSISTRVFDEQSKLNLRSLAATAEDQKKRGRDRLQRLLVEYRKETPFEMSDSEAEAWADLISDYVNGQRGVTIPSPKRTSNPPIQMVEELNFLEPIRDHRIDWLLHDQRKEDDVGAGLHRYVTVYGSGKLNLNTADVRVLRAYFPKNPEIADRIIERRDGAAEDSEGTSGTSGTGGTGGTSGSGGTGGTTGGTTGGITRGEEEDQGGNPFTAVTQVNEIEGVTAEILAANEVVLDRDFDVKSSFFSMRIVAATDVTRRDELFVVERVAATQADQPMQGFRFHLHQERTDALEEIEEEPLR